MILATAKWAPDPGVVDEFTGSTQWVAVHPDMVSVSFEGPPTGLVAVSATWGILTNGSAWAAALDLIGGSILAGSVVQLADSSAFKGQTSYDLVPIVVEPGLSYRLALAVRAYRARQTIEMKIGPNHPTALLEVYA